MNKLRVGSVALLAALVPLILLGVVSEPAQAVATISNSDFPSTRVVKDVIGENGRLYVYSGGFATLGGKPHDCRSDKQMLRYRAVRARSYSGTGGGSVYPGAEIVILRYASSDSARDAVNRNASYPRRCPKVTEWVCNQCDGISTSWRTRVSAARVGRQSVAWKFRQVDNFKSTGYAVVARQGATVVRVTVSHTRNVFANNGWVYPRLMKKQVALQLARRALTSAT